MGRVQLGTLSQILFKIEHTDVPLTYYTGILGMYSTISIYIDDYHVVLCHFVNFNFNQRKRNK